MVERDVTVRRIGDMEGAFGGPFKRVRAELGVTSFGMRSWSCHPTSTATPSTTTAETARRRSTWL